MGKELNTAKIILIVKAKIKSPDKGDEKPLVKWNKIAASIASPKLDKTPAAETNNSPFLISVKFKGLTGTGLAQPIIKDGAKPAKSGGIIKIAGTRIVPIGSIWGRGFRVNLPALWAVVSPNFKAISPCITSCKITEKSKIIIPNAKTVASII